MTSCSQGMGSASVTVTPERKICINRFPAGEAFVQHGAASFQGLERERERSGVVKRKTYDVSLRERQRQRERDRRRV